jgi:hypothetical protein
MNDVCLVECAVAFVLCSCNTGQAEPDQCTTRVLGTYA